MGLIGGAPDQQNAAREGGAVVARIAPGPSRGMRGGVRRGGTRDPPVRVQPSTWEHVEADVARHLESVFTLELQEGGTYYSILRERPIDDYWDIDDRDASDDDEQGASSSNVQEVPKNENRMVPASRVKNLGVGKVIQESRGSWQQRPRRRVALFPMGQEAEEEEDGVIYALQNDRLTAEDASLPAMLAQEYCLCKAGTQGVPAARQRSLSPARTYADDFEQDSDAACGEVSEKLDEGSDALSDNAGADRSTRDQEPTALAALDSSDEEL